MKYLFNFLILFLFVFGMSTDVSAHATPITYEPSASSTIETIPKNVTINFSERIDEGASSIVVFGPNGNEIQNGEARKSDADPRKYSVSIDDGGGEGTYTVSWQIVSSDDGHFTKGGFSFAVGEGNVAPTAGQVQIQHITTLPQAFTIGVELLGQALLLGVLFFLIFFWSKLKEEVSSHRKRIEKWLSIFITKGALLIVFGTLSFIILKTFDLMQLRSGSFQEVLKVFLGTVDGRYALIRAVLGLSSLLVFWVFRKEIFMGDWKRKGTITLLVFIGAMILIRARVSHAAASHFLPLLSILINALQLLFKEVWVGAVMVCASLIAPILIENKKIFGEFTIKFSRLLNVMFAGVGITGAYIVWLHLKDPSYLFSTEWGSRFILLSLLGGALLLLRIYNQFVVIKQKGHKFSLVGLMLEMWVGVALIFVTSLMIITTPPYATQKYSFERNATSGDALVKMSVYPYESSNFLITVKDTKTQEEVVVNNLVVTLTNNEKGVGPIVVPTINRFPGGYALPLSQFAPQGKWRVDITAQRQSGYDAVASFEVEYPNEIEKSLIDPDTRHFDLFTLACLIAAILIGLFAYYLNKLNRDLVLTEFESEKRIGVKVSVILSFILFALILAGIRYGNGTIFKTEFQKLCEKNGHFWIQSVPVMDGKALSSDTVTGCFLDVGMYHFVDQREYETFYQRKEISSQITAEPKDVSAGVETTITIDLAQIEQGRKQEEVAPMGIWHDRIMHVLVVSEDLKTFAHLHTEDLGPVTEEMKRDGKFSFKYTFPKAGRYALNIDYVAGGIEYTEVTYMYVQGSPTMVRLYPSTLKENAPITKNFEGYDVTFEAPKKIKAGEMVKLHYYITKDGEPVTNLEPYLGAAMHLGMVRNDLNRFFHTHGEALLPGSVWFQQLLGRYYKYHMHFAPDAFGPKLITPPYATKFTTPGVYTIFGEFQHNGNVIVTDFEVVVE